MAQCAYTKGEGKGVRCEEQSTHSVNEVDYCRPHALFIMATAAPRPRGGATEPRGGATEARGGATEPRGGIETPPTNEELAERGVHVCDTKAMDGFGNIGCSVCGKVAQ